MKVTASELVQQPSLGRTLHCVVDDLSPSTPVGLDVWIPVACLPDRRKRDGIAMPDGHEECVCCACDGCTAAIEICLAEHFARLNPDKLDQLDAMTAKRLVEIGGVSGKTINDKGAIVDNIAVPVEPIALKATGSLIANGS